ncbi:MAG: GMC family oxidoreductase [Bacteroidia bacterium]|nr:GMC family oxidoreductase [Bacteroidia bacterium]
MSDYDLILIGSGFASSFFLKKIKEKKAALRILLLEKGQKFTHQEELGYAAAAKQAPGYQLAETSLIQQNSDNHYFQFNQSFGGGSNCWLGCTPRFLPADFRLNSTYGIGKDWPISYEDLAPYYDEAESLMQISGPENTPWPKSGKYPLPPHGLTPFDRQLQEKYPDSVYAQATARASMPTAQRAKCCGSSVCSLCPLDAKFTIGNGMGEVFEGIDIMYGAEVYALELNNDRVRKVFYRKNGQEKEASADLFALGTNPIFNSHILLNSGDSHPLLGKGIGEQRSVMVNIDLGFDNSGGSSINSANMWMLYKGEQRKAAAACLIESQNSAQMIRLEKGKLRHLALFKCIFEDVYQEENHVRKSDNPFKAIVNYQGPSEYLRKGVERLKSKLDKIFEGLAVEKYQISPGLASTEAHIIGGHIMGNDPENSVLDEMQLHHQYRNLFVLGAGSFSSMSPANPTLTLAALSLRSADKMKF